MSINYKRIGLANNELSSIQVFRENEELLYAFFNNRRITNLNKLNEWKRIKLQQFKHFGQQEIDAADQLRKLSRDPAIATKRGHLSQCGIAEQDRTWVATHTDRQARGEESVLKPNTKKELEHHLAQIYDLCHARFVVGRDFRQGVSDMEALVRIRELENRLYDNIGQSDSGHQLALIMDSRQLGNLRALSSSSGSEAEIDRQIEDIKRKISDRKKSGYYKKYLKYKEKYLALKKKLNISNL